MRLIRVVLIGLTVAATVTVVSQIASANDTGTNKAPQRTQNAYVPGKPSDQPVSETLRGLAERGITVHVEQDASVEEARLARAAVEAGFGGFLDDSLGTTQEVVFTDIHYGSEDPESQHVTPFYVDTPALMVVLEHQPVPIFGGYSKESTLPESADETFVAFVDAKTGNVLRGVAFDPRGIPISPPGGAQLKAVQK